MARAPSGPDRGGRGPPARPAGNDLGRLPAVRAAAAAATTAAAARPAEAAAALTPAPTPAGGRRLLHLEAAAIDLLAVELGDGLLRILFSGHLHEAEAPGAAGIAVGHHGGRLDGSRP